MDSLQCFFTKLFGSLFRINLVEKLRTISFLNRIRETCRLILLYIYDPIGNELAIHQLLWIRQSVSANKPFTALRIRSTSVHFPYSSGSQRVEVNITLKKLVWKILYIREKFALSSGQLTLKNLKRNSPNFCLVFKKWFTITKFDCT